MNRKENYANLDLARKTRREQKNRYYGKTAFLYERRVWLPYEDQMVLDHTMPDTELSFRIQRSVTAIQVRRSVLKKAALAEDRLYQNIQKENYEQIENR